VTVTDWIVAAAAVVALALSIYNTYTQWKDRKPRVEITTSWIHPTAASMAIRGTANPPAGAPAGEKFEADPWKATYQCEITNVGIVGVKIRQVTLYPQAPPGRPIGLSLPEGEQARKLDSGDSQIWTVSVNTKDPLEVLRKRSPIVTTQVVAVDTVGNAYKAKDPGLFPIPNWDPIAAVLLKIDPFTNFRQSAFSEVHIHDPA
jgi:hypothetical protein